MRPLYQDVSGPKEMRAAFMYQIASQANRPKRRSTQMFAYTASATAVVVRT
jgi:hypothetical protein